MKKTKKPTALVLAMVMAFSLMAVTAAAYGGEHAHDETCCEETVIARKPAAPVCPYCGTVTTEVGLEWIGDNRYLVYECHGCDNGFRTTIRY